MRLNRRKVGLNLFNAGQICDGGVYFCFRCRSILSDAVDLILTETLATGYIYVDEGSQAIVLAEVATCIFITRSAITNVCHCVEPDKCRLFAIAPKAQCLLRRSDRSGFTTVLVHYD